MLSDKKLQAITLMVSGARFTEIEKAIGVSHTQLWRWRTADPEFADGLAQARAVTFQGLVDKLWGLTSRAMDVSLDALDEGDPVMARDILKMTVAGLTDVSLEPGTDDEEALALVAASELVCDDCGKECRSRAGLSSHMRTHTD